MNELVRKEAARKGWGLLDDDFDRFFEGFFRPVVRGEGALPAAGANFAPATDLIEHDNEYIVHAELPGMKKEDIHVTLQDGVLTINAENKFESEEKKEGRVIRQERRFGSYVRSMRLGGAVDESKVKANYKDGVLELILPKAEEVKPRQISVG
ncbi:MAG: Hsp20/alpha crystallin family protein [Gammaproteobacteria bacterium]|nr:Hsp20/alpha crystallin family protein [Gammaproteobacteria bacterium]